MQLLTTLDSTSVLANLLTEPLVVADVGCRWGFSDSWLRLGDRCTAIGFDPDAEECERLRKRYRSSPQVTLVPVGLGAEAGLATLYMTTAPGGYSLFPPEPEAVERHPGLDTGKLEGTAVVEVAALDDWCAQEGVGRIDVVKIDTQGSELDILRGAERILDTTRAVEVEVEFNELYTGVPLFGDIDRYLRSKGFVLWRLRNLAHYAQHGADKDWQGLEAHYWDEYAATFFSGSGQLYWANAFYLRSPVVHPPADAGWADLIRDAVVTSALGFRDLTGLALRQARQVAPPEVVEAIDVAQSDGRIAAAREQELAAATVALSSPLTVQIADGRFLGPGWGPPEHFGFGSLRWSGPTRDSVVDIPWTLPPGTRVEVLAVAAMTPEISETLALDVNRAPVPLVRTPHEFGTLHSGMVPHDFRSTRPYTRLVLRTVETVPHGSVYADSSDDRELGVAVAWVRLTPPVA